MVYVTNVVALCIICFSAPVMFGANVQGEPSANVQNSPSNSIYRAIPLIANETQLTPRRSGKVLTLADLKTNQIYEINLEKYVVRFYKNFLGYGFVCIKVRDTSKFITQEQFTKAYNSSGASPLRDITFLFRNLFGLLRVEPKCSVYDDPGIYDFGYGFTVPKQLILQDKSLKEKEKETELTRDNISKDLSRFDMLYEVKCSDQCIRFYCKKGMVYVGIKQGNGYVTQLPKNLQVALQALTGRFGSVNILTDKNADMSQFGEGWENPSTTTNQNLTNSSQLQTILRA